MTDDQAEYGLVMPFVVCDDHGGPFEGSAFVNGWECGWLAAKLAGCRDLGVIIHRYVDPRVVPQLDLLAMKYGYTLTSEPWDEHPDESTCVTFTPAAETDQ